MKTEAMEHDNDKNEMKKNFSSDAIKNLSGRIATYCTAIDTYEIHETIILYRGAKKSNKVQSF
ncbi:hypothetical protein EMA8858_04007 [Emticicia aquatica]|jgi:hypothetical protein|uniref:Uncharacterized protein n=1 Tax=Emticicia aquatica TaxID=1681835 RepID=A0ABM9AVM9_9BACT|nr:hypothetical protein [Emticicia aquatica]CAH0997872.1 hypothetical protein EMA8858_04007 [Emticicia aquatica]